ncbi:hypothetical protein ACFFTM_19275 [Pseudoduganella plicata]|uniref:Anti-sigma factor n=1 Tax=Pseudoduganella plicata TaxID=321984 RepID=A0A4P7BEI1_9BURK|nr:hypothetical protein [Pseudoduganella plicata]QBQ37024.1 hypothetical protein E1742_13225 [Pseudoduganella plicata]GGY99969.1 hypothetical protein GCM10007388_37100 [Pseudoduganella plicata]
MDQHKLRSLVFEKTGVKVDVDDPIFALVALNEAVLAEAVERHVERIDAASAALVRQAGAPAFEPGAAPAPTRAPPRSDTRLLAVALGAAAFGALLVLIGQALFFRPAPVAPVTVPAPLTSEQIAAIATGEKLQRALPKLDAKTRTAVLAEMSKP